MVGLINIYINIRYRPKVRTGTFSGEEPLHEFIPYIELNGNTFGNSQRGTDGY